MEVNTAILSLAEYNQLRDFKKTIEEGNTVQFYGNSWGLTFISTDEALKKAEQGNKELKDQIRFLEQANYELRNPKKVEPSPAFTLADVKKMSVWQFLKWKRK